MCLYRNHNEKVQHYAIFFQETEDEGVPILPKELSKTFTEEIKFDLSYSRWITISMVEKKEEVTMQTEEANKSKGKNHGSFGEPQLVP